MAGCSDIIIVIIQGKQIEPLSCRDFTIECVRKIEGLDLDHDGLALVL